MRAGALISLPAVEARQCVPASMAVVSTTSKSWVIMAVLAIIADAEQYFSNEPCLAAWVLRGMGIAFSGTARPSLVRVRRAVRPDVRNLAREALPTPV